MKLDLMNARAPNGRLIEPVRVFDSMEDISSYNSLDEIKKKPFGKFSLNSKKIADVESDTLGRFDNAIVNHKGNYVEQMQIIKTLNSNRFPDERPLNKYDLRTNEPSIIYDSYKERVNSKSMNEVLDKVHDIPSLTIGGALKEGKILSGNWSNRTSKRYADDNSATKNIGPGYYDITTFDNGSQGIKVPTIQFDKTSIDQEDKINSEKNITPSPTSYFEDISFHPKTSLVPLEFDNMKRFKELYQVERHVHFTGLLLSPDYDRKDGWDKPNIPVTLSFKGPARGDPFTKDAYSSFITPDSGSKASVKKNIATSPLKYSSSFQSKAGSGIQIPVPMSGEIGPGAYPGTEIPAIQIKSPNKISPPFIKSNNLHDIRFLNSNLNTLRPRFNVTHNVIADKQYSLNANSNSNLNKIPFQKTVGVIFSTDKIFDGNVYKQKIAKRKIKKIYPKLAEKFSDLEYSV